MVSRQCNQRSQDAPQISARKQEQVKSALQILEVRRRLAMADCAKLRRDSLRLACRAVAHA
jgi:hypothetical protein